MENDANFQRCKMTGIGAHIVATLSVVIMKLIRSVKEPIMKDYYVKECPFLHNITVNRISHNQPHRSKPIGLSGCYINQMRPQWASIKAVTEYQKMCERGQVENSFLNILSFREYGGKFPSHTKITTFFNNGKGKYKMNNYFF